MVTGIDGKMVYRLAEGNASMVSLLGSKGAHASEMASIGIPVPPGFVITTEACLEFFKVGRQLPGGLWDAIVANVRTLEEETGRTFGDPDNPLVVSVRSGSAVSMPGMMDTILNMGVTDLTVAGVAEMMKDERPAMDAYRRLVQGFGSVVLGIEKDKFETLLEEAKSSRGLAFDYELDAAALRELVTQFRGVITEVTGSDISDDPWVLLRQAIEAVFDSWNNPRAITYREFQGISHDLGTGCVIMAMVFGNLGPDSGTGVLFTRSPATGEKTLYGEFLRNAQGEDVVAGVRTPQRIETLQAEEASLYAEIEEMARKLEEHYKEVQDIEFTVERGKLYILQTRTAKRTAPAAVRIAVDFVEEGVLSKEDALGRIPASDITQVLMPRFDGDAKALATQTALLAVGVGGSPGAASGVVVLDPDRAVERAEAGDPVILVRHETSPDDVHGIIKAQGVLTSRGGMTSHAAVVTRGLGKPCVVGCEELHVDMVARTATARGVTVAEGDLISIDGGTGEVFVGELATVEPNADDLHELNVLLSWADEVRKLQVWANADTPQDAQRAHQNGAEGIGLCRTEHMFFAADRLPHIQALLEVGPQASKVIRETDELAKALELAPASERESLIRRVKEAREKVESSKEVLAFHTELAELEKFQTADFYGILKAMEGKPVVVRLLDAPLHEFLPHYEDLIREEEQIFAAQRASNGSQASFGAVLPRPEQRDAQGFLLTPRDAQPHDAETADELGESVPVSEAAVEHHRLLELVKALRETNPMLGHRGCRVGLTMPEIYEMQVRAIVTAACRLTEEGTKINPEIMIPIVSHVNELKWLRPRLRAVAKETRERLGVEVTYKFGTMIEVPRAALTAGEIAENTEFFSFGSNDLTQMTFGYSRDDAETKFLNHYVETEILPWNPFDSIDFTGVGRLMRIAVEEGRRVNPELPIGICGEHGGEPYSIAFCHEIGLNYVSASPYRVPVARLAAAQSALGHLKSNI
jgi:pyruvate,orthophosphate dikinase